MKKTEKTRKMLLLNGILFLVTFFCKRYIQTNRLLMEPWYNMLYALWIRPFFYFFGGGIIGCIIMCHKCFFREGQRKKEFYWFAVAVGLFGFLTVLVAPIIAWRTERFFVVPMVKNVIIYAMFGFFAMIGSNGLIRIHERKSL